MVVAHEVTELPERGIAAWFLGRMLHKFQLKREKETSRNGKAWESRWAEYLEGKASTDYLLRRALEEMGELAVSLRQHDAMGTPELRYAVIDECADVANFMALIAYKFRSYPYHPEGGMAEDIVRGGTLSEEADRRNKAEGRFITVSNPFIQAAITKEFVNQHGRNPENDEVTSYQGAWFVWLDVDGDGSQWFRREKDARGD